MDTNSKYLFFLFERYYPLGGWDDYKGEFDSLENALKFIKSHKDYPLLAHIVFKKKIIVKAYVDQSDYFKRYLWEFEKVKDDIS